MYRLLAANDKGKKMAILMIKEMTTLMINKMVKANDKRKKWRLFFYFLLRKTRGANVKKRQFLFFLLLGIPVGIASFANSTSASTDIAKSHKIKKLM